MANEPTKASDLEGEGGTAWVIPPDFKESPAGVAQWLVHAPGAHPYWSWYCVACVSLKSVSGIDEAFKQFPGATHEIIFVALNPDHPLPDIDDWKSMHWLKPADLVHQFIVNSDNDASELTSKIVEHICRAAISPDQDNRTYWKNCVNATAEHARLGGHPDA